MPEDSATPSTTANWEISKMKTFDFEKVNMLKKMVDYVSREYEKASIELENEIYNEFEIKEKCLDIDVECGYIAFATLYDGCGEWYFWTPTILQLSNIDNNAKKVLKFVSAVSKLKNQLENSDYKESTDSVVDFRIETDKKRIRVEIDNYAEDKCKYFYLKDFDKVEQWIKTNVNFGE